MSWQGNVPNGGKLIATCDTRGVRWSLFYLPTNSTQRYQNFKLIADELPGQANFWLSWCTKRSDFTRRGGGDRLRAYPEVWHWVRFQIRLNSLRLSRLQKLCVNSENEEVRLRSQRGPGGSEVGLEEFEALREAAEREAAAQALAG